jgi:hypothetical protein
MAGLRLPLRSPHEETRDETEEGTEDSPSFLSRVMEKIRQNRALVAVSIVAFVLFIIIIVLLWRFVGSDFFRHY